MIEKLCCISLTLAARFIGALDLSTSILAINFIAGEFYLDEQRLIAFDEIKLFLGLNWAKTTTDLPQILNHKWVLICLMIYSVVHFICSACLMLATILRKQSYAMPWLTFEIIGLANQASALTMYIFQNGFNEEMAINGSTYVPIASLYLFLCMYFWMVVFAAQESWLTESSDNKYSQSSNLCPIKSHVVHFHSPKSPSILYQNRSIFESPEPPIPSKYYQL